jgi:hypothetical protein
MDVRAPAQADAQLRLPNMFPFLDATGIAATNNIAQAPEPTIRTRAGGVSRGDRRTRRYSQLGTPRRGSAVADEKDRDG